MIYQGVCYIGIFHQMFTNTHLITWFKEFSSSLHIGVSSFVESFFIVQKREDLWKIASSQPRLLTCRPTESVSRYLSEDMAKFRLVFLSLKITLNSKKSEVVDSSDCQKNTVCLSRMLAKDILHSCKLTWQDEMAGPWMSEDVFPTQKWGKIQPAIRDLLVYLPHGYQGGNFFWNYLDHLTPLALSSKICSICLTVWPWYF